MSTLNEDFFKACRYGNLSLVKLCLSLGTDVHANKDLALQWAEVKGNLEVVKFLVSQGADVHADDDGALRWADRYGHKEVVAYLQSLKNK